METSHIIMSYFWLNQRDDHNPRYRNKKGEVYHYRATVPGSKQLTKGDWFVYYMPGEYILFGAGRIGDIDIVTGSKENKKMTNYYANIDIYQPFEPAVSARDIKPEISFLKEKDGLSGVPQQSIYEISRDDYLTILKYADSVELLLDEA